MSQRVWWNCQRSNLLLTFIVSLMQQLVVTMKCVSSCLFLRLDFVVLVQAIQLLFQDRLCPDHLQSHQEDCLELISFRLNLFSLAFPLFMVQYLFLLLYFLIVLFQDIPNLKVSNPMNFFVGKVFFLLIHPLLKQQFCTCDKGNQEWSLLYRHGKTRMHPS